MNLTCLETPGKTPAAECRVRILLNGQPIWPATDRQQAPTDRAGSRYESAVVVKPGNRVEHILAQNAD